MSPQELRLDLDLTSAASKQFVLLELSVPWEGPTEKAILKIRATKAEMVMEECQHQWVESWMSSHRGGIQGGYGSEELICGRGNATWTHIRACETPAGSPGQE